MWCVSLALTGIMTFFVVMTNLKQDVVRACVNGLCLFALSCYLDIIFLLIMEGIWENGAPILLQGMGLLISKGILLTLLLTRAVAGQDDRSILGEDQKRSWQFMDGLTIGITVFFLFLAIVFLFFYTMLSEWEKEAAGGLFFMTWIFTLLLAVLSLYYISCYLYRRKQQEFKRQYEKEAGKQETDFYLESVENHYQRTRELWHDLKNHLTLLDMLFKEGKLDEAQDYLRIFAEDVDSITLPVKSGNTVVDALLADKLARAKREDIPFSLSLCDLTGLSLKPNEICGLLGNLLDNALEANAQVEEGRFVSVECKEREDCYVIRVRNAVKTVEDRESSYKAHSSKTDRRNQVGHGLGLRSVERLVHGCGGEFVTDHSAREFTAAVWIPRNMM